MDIFCSTIIPTVGRASLGRTVESVLTQKFEAAPFEVIVVNDSGRPLPEAAWQRDGRVQLLNTRRRERSVARNTGAAVSRGRYLHFLDDDDWLAPDAFRHLWELDQSSTAGWLYGITQLVNRQEDPLIRLRHALSGSGFLQTMAGEWIPLQSSFIRSAAFFAVGGFNPTLIGPEDIDLLRRIALRFELAETPRLISMLQIGDGDTTTDYNAHPESSRRARESILDEPGSWARMRAGVSASSWSGRMVRIYLTSAVWNLRRGRFMTAAQRSTQGLAAGLASWTHLGTPSFWQALGRPYESDTFRRGLEEAGMAA